MDDEVQPRIPTTTLNVPQIVPKSQRKNCIRALFCIHVLETVFESDIHVSVPMVNTTCRADYFISLNTSTDNK